jgi:hypothetical protein
VGGFLRFLLTLALLLAVFVLVVLPLLLGPLLTSMVRDMGLRSDTLSVSVALFDPTLILGRSRRVELDAGNVDAAPARIRQMSLSVGDASFLDRSFATVSGQLSDVSITAGSDTLSVSLIQISGPSDAAQATARLSAAETENLVRVAARRVGLTLDTVQLTPTGLTVSSHGFTAQAQVAVHGGALTLDPGIGGAIVLFQPTPSDPYTLEEAWISTDGLNVRGTVDLARLTRQLSN